MFNLFEKKTGGEKGGGIGRFRIGMNREVENRDVEHGNIGETMVQIWPFLKIYITLIH